MKKVIGRPNGAFQFLLMYEKHTYHKFAQPGTPFEGQIYYPLFMG